MTGARTGTRGAPHFYRAHGLAIRSELAIPEFRAVEPGPADVEIRLDPEARRVAEEAGALAAPDTSAVTVHRASTAADGACFHVAEVGSFRVRDGREIGIALEPGVDRSLVTLYVLGTAMGLVLFQRGALVLHGASVVHGGRATLFLGPSGAGKSTLAARLGQAGLPILGDDTAALWPGPGGYRVHPAGTSFKVWRDALDAAGLRAEGLAPVGNRIEKFYLANPRRAEERPHGIGEVMILGSLPPGEAPRIERLDGLEAVREVSANAYRPQFVDIFGTGAEHFRQVAALVAEVPVSRLLRPWDHGAAGAVADLLLRHRALCEPDPAAGAGR